MRNKHSTFWLALGDAGLTFGAYSLAFLIWLGGFPAYNWEPFLLIAPFLVGVNFLVLVLYNGYRDLHRPYLEVVGACLIASFATIMASATIAYLDHDLRSFPRGVLFIGGLLHLLLLPLWRSLSVRSAKKEYFERPAILVTYSDRPEALPDYIHLKGTFTPAQVLDNGNAGSERFIIIGADVPPAERDTLIQWAFQRHFDVHVVPTLYEMLVKSADLSKLGDRPVLTFRPVSIPPDLRALKRVIDLVGGALLLVISLPFWILVPLAIVLTSPGLIFFRQERVGEGGRLFHVWKFRTMVVDAEKETGPVFAQVHDPRVTAVGKLLRATRLDELPQIFNVLLGEMSLVGPRPERPNFVSEFAAESPLYDLRHQVKPGITGLAQVMGRYATTAQDKLRYDLLYITDYSPWLDLRILFWTVQVVIVPQSWVDEPPRWAEGLDWQGHYEHRSRPRPK